MSSENLLKSTRASMTPYALIFAAVHLPLALVIGYLASGLKAKSGGGLGVVLIMSAAYVVGWRFASRHRRPFSGSERWLLIGGCAVYMILFEALGLFGNYESIGSMSALGWVGLAAFTLGLDVLFLWIAFRYTVRKMMEKQIAKFTTNAV
jgi:hypothetical protein